jgi:dynein heavy chain, axonemal
MGSPGGGRNNIPARLARHFHLLTFADMSDESMGQIFTTILSSAFGDKFADDVRDAVPRVVAATMELYNKARYVNGRMVPGSKPALIVG